MKGPKSLNPGYFLMKVLKISTLLEFMVITLFYIIRYDELWYSVLEQFIICYYYE